MKRQNLTIDVSGLLERAWLLHPDLGWYARARVNFRVDIPIAVSGVFTNLQMDVGGLTFMQHMRRLIHKYPLLEDYEGDGWILFYDKCPRYKLTTPPGFHGKNANEQKNTGELSLRDFRSTGL